MASKRRVNAGFDEWYINFAAVNLGLILMKNIKYTL